MSKYTGEKLEYVKKLLRKDQNLSITKAVKKMCKKFDIEYTDSARVSVTTTLKRRDFNRIEEKSIQFKQAQQKTFDKKKSIFIITWAQNNTPVHDNFFKNIKAYAEVREANLHVIAGRYKNPTSIWTYKNQSEEFWAREVSPYLDAGRHNIHQYLQVLSDVKISPTASTPLSGLNGITGLETCIVGHPRIHLKSLPVLEGYPHKLLLSTGACTIANYTDSKSGKKGEFHHALGFAIVELDEDFFHIRQVSADENGNFYDFLHRVKDGEVSANRDGIEAAILGDVHTRHNNKVVTKKVFQLLDILKPKHTLIHDVAEMESILHWDLKDPFRLLQKEEEGLDNLEEEIDEIIAWMSKHSKYNLVMARSNHDDMLDRWLKATDWRISPNKKIYLKLANIMINEPEARRKGILPFLIDKELDGAIKTLSLDCSFRVKGWELAMHGHLGANGSRGGHNQFKNLNTKNIVGHGHKPHREDGHIMVGTLSYLRVGFNRGPSSWMNGFGIIHLDGKAQNINIIKNKFCRDMPI